MGASAQASAVDKKLPLANSSIDIDKHIRSHGQPFLRGLQRQNEKLYHKARSKYLQSPHFLGHNSKLKEFQDLGGFFNM